MTSENKVYKQFWMCSDSIDRDAGCDDIIHMVKPNRYYREIHVIEYAALESANAEISFRKECSKLQTKIYIKCLGESTLELVMLQSENKKLADQVKQLRSGARQFAKDVIENSCEEAYNNIQAKEFLKELEALKTTATKEEL